MELLIVRHGDPDYTIDSLTEKGRVEAALLAKKLSGMKIDACYCSPLGRAKDTAAYTLEKIGQTAEELDWLHEFRGTVFLENGEEQRCWDLMPSHWMKDEIYYSKDWYKGEILQGGSVNVEQEYKRVTAAFDGFLKEHGYERDGHLFKVTHSNHDRIVLFCHYAIGAVLTAHLMGVSPMTFLHHAVALTTSITTFVTEEREQGIAAFRMLAYGDTGHLYAGGEEPSFAARFCECYEDETRH